MLTCTRRVQFCAGHRVLGHESKCANPHGHNYVALFTAQAAVDEIGRVIDFSVLKARLGGWIDEHWDHAFLVNRADDGLHTALGPHGKLFVCDFNPTAELMARHLLHDVAPRALAETGVVVTRVRIWETENCYAEAAL